MKNRSTSRKQPIQMNDKQEKWLFIAISLLLFWLFTADGVLDVRLERRLALIALLAAIAIRIIPAGRRAFKELRIQQFLPGLYIMWCMAATVYAISTQFALIELARLLIALPVFLAVVVFARRDGKRLLNTLRAFSGATMLMGLMSVDSASMNILYRGYAYVMTIFTPNLQKTGGYESGIRVRGIIADPNLYSGVMALGTLIALYVMLCVYKNKEADKKEKILSVLILSVNASGYIMAFSMGSLFFFAFSCIVFIIFSEKKDRLAAFILMMWTGLTSAVCAFVSYAGLGKSGARACIPVCMLAVSAIGLYLLEQYLSDRIENAAKNKPRRAWMIVAAAAVLVIVFAIAAVNITGPAGLAKGETLRRSRYLKAGDYTLAIEAEGSMQATIESQSKTDLKTHNRTVLANEEIRNDGTREMTFRVPEDSEIVWFTFKTESGGTISKLAYSGAENGEIPLKYKLLPGFVANRLQNLFANENAVQRTVFFQDGLRLFKEGPIIGRGLGGYKNGVYSVQDFHYSSDYVHNQYIQALCDTGLIGFILFVAMLAAAFAAVLGEWKQKREGRALTPMYMACLVQMSAQALSDAVWSSGTYLILCFALLGLIAATTRGHRLPIGGKGKKAAYAATLVVYTFFFVSILINLILQNETIKGVSFEQLTKNISLELYDKEDFKLIYLQAALESPEEADARTADRFAKDLRDARLNNAYYRTAVYYLRTGQTEEVFDTLQKGLAYNRSISAAWQEAFDLLTEYYDVSGADIQEAENILGENKENYRRILDLYGQMEQTNEELILPVELSGQAQEFVEKLKIADSQKTWDDNRKTAEILTGKNTN